MSRRAAIVAVAATLTLLAACSSVSRHPAGAPSPGTAVSSTTIPSVTSDRTVWLCRPGQQPDPCTSDLTATAVSATGARHVEAAPAVYRGNLDCFFVYPTVSGEQTANADLKVQPLISYVAGAEAARFSSVCRVWAPIYRQRTSSDLRNLADDAPDSAANLRALASLRAAWRDYLTHDNGGRRVVFIGHSQGAAMLIRLLRADIDPDPTLRARTAMALLIGGNVTVTRGGIIGGSFTHLPLCTKRGELHCVIAYSTFPSQPPIGAFFGRAGFGVSYLAGESVSTAERDVACVNPAALSGGSALLDSYFPTPSYRLSGVATAWTRFPGRYRATCEHGGGATWLQVTPTGGAHDVRPKVTEVLGPLWGYHVADVNLALGNLVDDVRAVATQH